MLSLYEKIKKKVTDLLNSFRKEKEEVPAVSKSVSSPAINDYIKNLYASMETSGDILGDWLQLEESTFNDLKERKKISADIKFEDIKKNPVLYNETANAYIKDLKETFKLPDDETAALWSFRPGWYKKYGGKIENIPETALGSFGKTGKDVMRQRMNSLNNYLKSIGRKPRLDIGMLNPFQVKTAEAVSLPYKTPSELKPYRPETSITPIAPTTPADKMAVFGKRLELGMPQLSKELEDIIVKKPFKTPPELKPYRPETSQMIFEPTEEAVFEKSLELGMPQLSKELENIIGKDKLRELEIGKKRQEAIIERAMPIALTISGFPLAAAVMEVYPMAKNAIVTALKKEKFNIWEQQTLTGMLPKGTPLPLQIGVGVAETIVDMILMGNIIKASQSGALKEGMANQWRGFTKKTITEYKLPHDLYLDARKVRSVFQTGEAISPQEIELLKDVGLSKEMWREATMKGITIKVPTEKLITIADKPYYSRIKKLFNIQPSPVFSPKIERVGKPYIVTPGQRHALPYFPSKPVVPSAPRAGGLPAGIGGRETPPVKPSPAKPEVAKLPIVAPALDFMDMGPLKGIAREEGGRIGLNKRLGAEQNKEAVRHELGHEIERQLKLRDNSEIVDEFGMDADVKAKVMNRKENIAEAINQILIGNQEVIAKHPKLVALLSEKAGNLKDVVAKLDADIDAYHSKLSPKEVAKGGGITVYRASRTPYDSGKVKDVVFVTPDRKRAEFWQKAQGYEYLEELKINKDTKILKRKDIPKQFIREEGGINFTSLDDQAAIIKYAKEKGYDAIEDYGIAPDGSIISKELIVLNPSKLSPTAKGGEIAKEGGEPEPKETISLLDLVKKGKREITEEELFRLKDVQDKRITSEDMKAYLESKGIKVIPPPPSKPPVKIVALQPEPEESSFKELIDFFEKKGLEIKKDISELSEEQKQEFLSDFFKDAEQDPSMNLFKAIRSLGGIKSYGKGYQKGELEKIPLTLKNNITGKYLDEMVIELKSMYGWTFSDTNELLDTIDTLSKRKEFGLKNIKLSVTKNPSEKNKVFNKIEKLLSKPLSPSKVKSIISEATGIKKTSPKVTLPETVGLKWQLKKEAKGAAIGFKAGRREVIRQRGVLLKAEQEKYNLTDSEFKPLLHDRNFGVLSDKDFKEFLDRVRTSAGKAYEKKQVRNQLISHIEEKELKVENLRKAMKLPSIEKMTIGQMQEFDKALEPFKEADIFLPVRQIEVVDRAEKLKGARTYREIKEKLAKEMNIPVEQLNTIKVSEFDRFLGDTPLTQRNAFFKMMVEGEAEQDLIKTDEYLKIKHEVMPLAEKVKTDFLIPQHKKIFNFIQASPEEKKAISLSKEELDLTNYIIRELEKAREYLIATESMGEGREDYFVHIHRGILEALKEEKLTFVGIKNVIKEVLQKHKIIRQNLSIRDEQTGEILPFNTWFRFAMHRTGGVKPTKNVVQAFLTYMKIFKKKQALDETVPYIKIFAQSLTPQNLTPAGKQLHGKLVEFVNTWLNTKRGKVNTFIGVQQGGIIDRTLQAIKTFTCMRDLALNLSVQFLTPVGEQAATYQLLGKRKYILGKIRYETKQGKEITKKYENLIGENPWTNLIEPAKSIGKRLEEGLFIMFADSRVRANKTFLLGSLSKEEFAAGAIDPKRLTALRTELGRYRSIPGTSSIVGSSSIGKSYTQYRQWALPILHTNYVNFKNISIKLLDKTIDAETKKKSFFELYKMLELSAFVAIIYGFVVKPLKEERSFRGRLIRKAYNELNTVLQASNPFNYFSFGRLASFVSKVGAALNSLLKLERYKEGEREGQLKGFQMLKREFTPVAITQFTSKKADMSADTVERILKRLKEEKKQTEWKTNTWKTNTWKKQKGWKTNTWQTGTTP